MSPSKPARAGAKPAAKTKPKAKAAPVAGAVETLRIIPAPEPERIELDLTPAEKARSVKAQSLAAEIEQALRGEAAPVLDPQAIQALMASLCRLYSAHTDNGLQYDIVSQTNPVTATDVMVTSSALLKAANVAVFELGMWQSWTGR